MSLFGISFGSSDSSQSTTTNSTTDTTGKTTTNSNTTGAQQAATSSLSQADQDFIRQLIQSSASNPTGSAATANASQLANLLTTRAQGADASGNASIAASVAEAARAGQQSIQQSVTKLAGQTGSSQNSFVQQVGIEGGVQLQSQLAALKEQLGLQNRQAATGEISNAITANAAVPALQAQQTQQLVQLFDILKGASTTATSTSQEQTQSIADMIQHAIQTGTSNTNGSQSSSGFTFGS